MTVCLSVCLINTYVNNIFLSVYFSFHLYLFYQFYLYLSLSHTHTHTHTYGSLYISFSPFLSLFPFLNLSLSLSFLLPFSPAVIKWGVQILSHVCWNSRRLIEKLSNRYFFYLWVSITGGKIFEACRISVTRASAPKICFNLYWTNFLYLLQLSTFWILDTCCWDSANLKNLT